MSPSVSSSSPASRIFLLVSAAVLAAFPLSLPVEAQLPAGPHPSPTAEACVLLRNGNVLSGAVQTTEDGYVVTRQGATVHVKAYQVQAVCKDMTAAYEHQRSAIAPGQVIPHLQLAEWCLQHGLWDAARQEINQAALREPNHPRLAVLERRLGLALEPRHLAASAPAGLSAEAPVPTGAGVASESLADAEFVDLPDETMEQFRRRIQPLLLNSCTTSGCHRSEGTSAFVLDRRALWRDAPHTLTARNLSRTLNYVDLDAPRESPLLRAAGSVHSADLKSEPIAPRSTSFELMQEWLIYISGGERDPAAGDDGASPPEAPGADHPHEDSDVAISDEELDELLYGDRQQDSPADRRVQRGVVPRPTRSRDPFDPEEFNRRYSPRGPNPRPASGPGTMGGR